MRKTSNPVFTEGKSLHGNMPTQPRTDSMFDRHYNAEEHLKEEAKRQEAKQIHGQTQKKPTGEQPRVTQPGSQQINGTPTTHVYFNQPGDFQTLG